MQTDHFVQTFKKKGARLIGAQPEKCKSPEQARARGEKAATYAAGVLVFSVTSEPDFDEYDPPVVLERYGEVPPEFA